ncbi:hypothetical protein [Lentibacillus sp. CBA3610]|uniref:hypothetical protein n=1 Tax=Lentibacillus sp. CBA3610 TaxID=2518176 RepID=UPI0015961CC9|nr:hypothetical protein [Lentibacillus sp. CBA3610]QKY69963.1 hypothetical protein Len3610_10510 [Lentibacillus sp. CBA3610]
MTTVKMMKPYYINVSDSHIQVILGYKSFTLVMNNQVYRFVPAESREIRINRSTQKVENLEARFTFEKDNEIIYMTLNELISIPDVLVQLHEIVKPYYQDNDENSVIIDELEHMNVKRLIDKALDNWDRETFEALLKLL